MIVNKQLSVAGYAQRRQAGTALFVASFHIVRRITWSRDQN